jgi:hypothetical protein
MYSMIRFLLTIAIVILIIRWISKLFSPRFSENQQGSNFQNRSKEGATTIHPKKQEKKNSSENKGEYVDFEEID